MTFAGYTRERPVSVVVWERRMMTALSAEEYITKNSARSSDNTWSPAEFSFIRSFTAYKNFVFYKNLGYLQEP